MNSNNQLNVSRLTKIQVKRSNLFVILSVLFITVTGYSTNCFSGIIYSDGFENGLSSSGIGPHTGGSHCCSWSLTTGTTGDSYPVNSGSYSFRSYVQSGDPAVQGHSARAELSAYYNQYHVDKYESWNDTRWYGFSVYMPNKGAGHTYRGAGVFFQFHQYGDSSGIPFVIGMMTMGDSPTWYAYGHNPSYTTYFTEDATDDVGEWTDFILEVDWGKDNSWTGVFKVWINGTLVWNQDPFYNSTDGRDETFSPYVKIGIDYPGTVDDYPMYAYHDNFVVGDENSSLSEMQTAMGGGNPDPDPEPEPEPDPDPKEEILEAESATLSGLVKKYDSDASNGYYVATESRDTGEISFHVDVANAGLYKINGRVFAADGGNNSFYFTIDDQKEDIWDFIGQFNMWQLLDLSKRGTGAYDNPQYNPYTFQLSAGSHTITLRGRETDARLDYIKLERLDGAVISPPAEFNIVQ